MLFCGFLGVCVVVVMVKGVVIVVVSVVSKMKAVVGSNRSLR